MPDKRCSKCGEAKSLSSFPVNKSRVSGRGAYCRSCQNDAQRVWRSANLNRAHEQEQRWRDSNKEKTQAKAKRHYAANKSSEKRRLKAWRIANEERMLFSDARRSIKRSTGTTDAIPAELVKARASLILVQRLIRRTGDWRAYNRSLARW